MTNKTVGDARMPVVASRRQFVLGTAAFMACAALPFPVFAAPTAAQQIADHFSSVKTMMGEFVQFGPRGLHLIVEIQLRRIGQIVEQRVQLVVEQRQPVLHAGEAAH